MSAINMRPFPEQAWLFARCSEIAYSDAPEATPLFQELGFESTFIDVDGSQAYFLKNDDDLVFVCRGTQPTQWSDIAADLDAVPVPSSTGIGRVHQGFKKSVDNVWPKLKDIANHYGKSHTIWVTGHSLGAAMALITSYKLQRDPDMPNPQALFTYGCPRAGDKKYIAAMEASGLLHFRFVNNADIVARVPIWPFKHFAGAMYMNHWGNLRTLTGWQLTKDVWRGFLVGIKKRDINFFSNHSITRYAANLLNWMQGVETPQT
jgi:triacylglycerol lipase